MIKNYVIDFFDIVFISVLLVFVIVKIFVMMRMNVKVGVIDIFFSSLLIYDKQSVKNTFDEDLQRYYRVSNKINKGFYFLFIGLIALYFLMLAI
jgi:hypothetical protein